MEMVFDMDSKDRQMTESSKRLRLLEEEEAKDLLHKVQNIADPSGESVAVSLTGWWQAELRWSRNRINLASDRRDINLTVSRQINGVWGSGSTNQLDDYSIKGVIDLAERTASLKNKRLKESFEIDPPRLPEPSPEIWSDTTFNCPADERAAFTASAIAGAMSNDLVSAGYTEIRGGLTASYMPRTYRPDRFSYTRFSQAQCSLTIRHPEGNGSGWAGKSSFDWSALNVEHLTSLALEKCLASVNPVAIEPGRYTAILEPKATSDLVGPLLEEPLNLRERAENGEPPFALARDTNLRLVRTKLGMKVIDERISITHNPEDPLLGIVPFPGLTPIKWIENGVLTAMAYPRPGYSLGKLNDNLAADQRLSYRMSGGSTSVDDMIGDTERGVLVTRIWGVKVLHAASVLLTGITRDGLWLIENGKISKAIKNFRITESPLFALNQVEAIGASVPVFSPVTNPYYVGINPVIVPTLKVRDFSFTSMVDAV